MAHFAKLGAGNIVEDVITVNNDILLDADGIEQEQLGIDFCHSLFGNNTTWVQTSYNKSFRKNYAAKGYTYMSSIDGFVPPQPSDENGLYQSWTLSETTGNWTPPIAMPEDDNEYKWNEANQTWDAI